MSSSTRLNTPQMNQRPLSPNSTPGQGQPAPAAGNGGSQMSRAERFEDEKRRIIESCFSKLDQNGQLAESYITHIRIQEDAAYPSMPPPPESPVENRKPRIVIIAVKSTGRVRMHKARENNNGSFSIGKTWNMEELTAIESYSNCPTPPQTEREAQHRQWAGSVGFTVTITKPYYWQAGTSKEKDFFIASAVKIFRKYTKGQIPELRGFGEAEKAAIIGAAPVGPGQTSPPGAPPQAANRAPGPGGPQPPFAAREQSRDESRYRQSPGPPGSGPSSRQPSESPARFASPQPPMGGMASRSPPINDPAAMRMRSQESLHAQSQFRAGMGPRQRSPSMGQEATLAAGSPRRQDGNQMTPPPRRDPNAQGPPPIIPPSPLRQRDARQLSNGYPERTADAGPMANGSGGANGAKAFQNARERWANQSPGNAAGGLGQLPPVDPPYARSATMSSADGRAQTPASESSGFDMGDSAGAITSYWQQEAAAAPPAAAPTPAPAPAPTTTPALIARNAALNEPASPPTPERSKRRPQPERNGSQSTLDLRPAPLSQARRATNEKLENVPSHGTSRQVASQAAQEVSRHAIPETEPIATPRVDEVRPLNVQNKSETLQSNKPEPAKQVAPTSVAAAALSSPASSASATPAEEKEEPEAAAPADYEEQFRPGLGPMIRKQAVAARFKAAATAANAFKPRPGGAAERILQQKAQREGEPDGITGVVPRPMPRQEPKPEVPPPVVIEDQVATEVQPEPSPVVEAVPPQPVQDAAPVVQNKSIEIVEDPQKPQTTSASTTTSAPAEATAGSKIEQRHVQQPQIKIKRRSAFQEKNIAALEIDRKLLDGRGIEFDSMLSDFGWNRNILRPNQLLDFERDIRRELGRVEAGSWLSQADVAREEKVHHVEALLNKAIEECDELEGLLTLYNVELSSLNDDIAYIEAQSQGLQVQSANQKLLHSELQTLVSTMSIDRRTMEPLQHADLSNPNAIEEIEGSLLRLYQAMLRIDPTMHSSAMHRPGSRGTTGEAETSNMVALREKKDVYERECVKFSKRLVDCLDTKFTVSFNDVKSRALRPGTRGGISKLDENAFIDARAGLWIYGPLILFMKELNRPAWIKALTNYQSRVKPLYSDTFRDNISNWKRAARAPTGDESEILFTHQEKEDPATGGGITSTARRVAVKRSQTIAKTFRSATSEHKHSAIEHRQVGSFGRAGAFGCAMDEMAPLINKEQNFIVDLFHATSLETEDFPDAVRAAAPAQRRGTNLLERKPIDPDRSMASNVTRATNEIFASFATDLSAMLDWAISDDPLQGVGIMASLSKHSFYLQDTNQEYLLQLVDTLAARLQTRFAKFVEEQIRAIDDTKVKIKKRKGVISFMKTFPHFSTAVETIFAEVAGKDYAGPHDCVAEVRKLIDDSYDRINRAMFDSLKAIAKESPAAGIPAAPQQARAGDDSEDKSMLNYHVLIIENMNHYVEEVDDGAREGVLAHWKARALMERAEALEGYVGRVIRRPLGKILVSPPLLRRS